MSQVRHRKLWHRTHHCNPSEAHALTGLRVVEGQRGKTFMAAVVVLQYCEDQPSWAIIVLVYDDDGQVVEPTDENKVGSGIENIVLVPVTADPI